MDLTQTIFTVIEKNIEKKHEITLASNLREDLEVDSFGRLMIVNALEDEFNITITDEDLADINTVGDIVTKLEKYLKQKNR